jgi:hypothetical protein
MDSSEEEATRICVAAAARTLAPDSSEEEEAATVPVVPEPGGSAGTATERTGEHSFEVERVLKERVRKGNSEFLIRWTSYGPDQDSWEPRNNVDNSAVAEFRRRRREQQQQSQQQSQRQSKEGGKPRLAGAHQSAAGGAPKRARAPFTHTCDSSEEEATRNAEAERERALKLAPPKRPSVGAKPAVVLDSSDEELAAAALAAEREAREAREHEPSRARKGSAPAASSNIERGRVHFAPSTESPPQSRERLHKRARSLSDASLEGAGKPPATAACRSSAGAPPKRQRAALATPSVAAAAAAVVVEAENGCAACGYVVCGCAAQARLGL